MNLMSDAEKNNFEDNLRNMFVDGQRQEYNLQISILATLTLAKCKSFDILSSKNKVSSALGQRLTLNIASVSRIKKLLAKKTLRPTKNVTESGNNAVSKSDIAIAQIVCEMYRTTCPTCSFNYNSVRQFEQRLRAVPLSRFMPPPPLEAEQYKELIENSNPHSLQSIFDIFRQWTVMFPKDMIHGILSRWWLHSTIAKNWNNLAYFPVEIIFLRCQTEISSILCIPHENSEKQQQEFNELLFQAMRDSLSAYFFSTEPNPFIEHENKYMPHWMGQPHLEKARKSEEIQKINQYIENLRQGSSIEEEELTFLHETIEKMCLPFLGGETDELEWFIKQLRIACREKEKKSESDILLLLYSAAYCIRKYYSFYLPEQNNLKDAGVVFAKTGKPSKKRGRKPSEANKIIPEEVFYRCCLNVCRQEIKIHYKGNGCGSPRSHAIRTCSFLKEKFQKSQFEKYYREFKKKFQDKAHAMELEGPCPATEKCPWCQ